MPSLAWSVFSSVSDNRPKGQVTDWPELVRLLSVHDVRDSKDGPLFSLNTYRTDGRKCLEDLETFAGLILDFDHLETRRAVEIVCQARDSLDCLVYSTISHGPGAPRFRIVIPYSRHVTPAEHDRLWRLTRTLWPEIDEKCRSGHMAYFTPAVRPGAECWIVRGTGPILDVDRALTVAPPEEAAQSRRISIPARASDDDGDQITTAQFCAWARKYAKKPDSLSGPVESLTLGRPFAEDGQRDETLFRLAGVVARAFPRGSVSSLAAHFTASVASTKDTKITDLIVRYKLRRALEAERVRLADEPDFSRDPEGRVRGTSDNLILAVEAICRGRLRLDDFAHREEIRESPEGPWREIRDTDYLEIAQAIERKWPYSPQVGAIPGVVSLVCQRARVNPPVEWLQGLQWDGTTRIGDWLVRAGCEDSPECRLIGRLWLLQSVARLLKPGCKADYCLILEGEPGLGKSTLLRTLAGESWFSDDLSEIGQKGAAERLQGKWIVELAELAAARRSDQETLKAFISRASDRFRPAYGRKAVDYPRACVFAGTTNDFQYLQDVTGARRFWPVRVVRPLELTDREQLLAEAVALLSSGAAYWPTGQEEQDLLGTQERRRIRDSWEDVLEDWLVRPVGYSEAVDLTTRWILERIIGADRPSRADDYRLVSVLRKLRWTRDGRSWVPPKPVAVQKPGLRAV